MPSSCPRSSSIDSGGDIPVYSSLSLPDKRAGGRSRRSASPYASRILPMLGIERPAPRSRRRESAFESRLGACRRRSGIVAGVEPTATTKSHPMGYGGFLRLLVVILLPATNTESHRDLRSAETPEGIVLQFIEISGVTAILLSCLRGENAG